jgi:hypothetical protein
VTLRRILTLSPATATQYPYSILTGSSTALASYPAPSSTSPAAPHSSAPHSSAPHSSGLPDHSTCTTLVFEQPSCFSRHLAAGAVRTASNRAVKSMATTTTTTTTNATITTNTSETNIWSSLNFVVVAAASHIDAGCYLQVRRDPD